MTEQMPGELIYEYTHPFDRDGDLRADRGTNRLARQAVLGERADRRRSNPSI